jgi:hypothetical protein
MQEGINCNIGREPCTDGIKVPADKRLAVTSPSAEDRELHSKILESTVLASWAKRCGESCSADWNRTIGSILHLKAATR